MKQWLLLGLLCGPVLASAGQLHKWVDEHGKVHYGDKVPTQHEQNATPVETPVNVIDSNHDRTYVPPSYEPPEPEAKADKKKKKPLVTRPDYDSGKNPACAKQWKAYREARQCFSKCPRTIGPRGERWYDEECGCENLPMPTCVP